MVCGLTWKLHLTRTIFLKNFKKKNCV
jgi:hypothetical protein